MLTIPLPDTKSFLVGIIGAALADIAIIVPAQVQGSLGLDLWLSEGVFVLAWAVCCAFLGGVIVGLWLTRDIRWQDAMVAFVLTVGIGAAAGMATLHWTGVS